MAAEKKGKCLLTSTTQAQSTGVGRAQNMEALKDITGVVH
jgi:hypothetical protein